MQMLKLGWNGATCIKKSCVQTDLELCEKYGYDYIELRLSMLEEYFKEHELSDLNSFFSKNHLKPYAINSIENVNFNTHEQWEMLLDEFTHTCRIAQAIDCPYLIIVPSKRLYAKGKSEKEVFEDSINVLYKLADIAETYGVKLAFEPIGDRRWYCNSLQQAWEIVKTVDRDNVGLTIDCINIYMYDKCNDLDILDEIDGNKIFVFHMNDCKNQPLSLIDPLTQRIMPGDGGIPIKNIINKIKATGYDGIASLELFNNDYWEMDPDDVIRIGAEKCKIYL